MKALHEKVNIIPLIAKADCLTTNEIKKLKDRVSPSAATQWTQHVFHRLQLGRCNRSSDSSLDTRGNRQVRDQSVPVPRMWLWWGWRVQTARQRAEGESELSDTFNSHYIKHFNVGLSVRSFHLSYVYGKTCYLGRITAGILKFPQNTLSLKIPTRHKKDLFYLFIIYYYYYCYYYYYYLFCWLKWTVCSIKRVLLAEIKYKTINYVFLIVGLSSWSQQPCLYGDKPNSDSVVICNLKTNYAHCSFKSSQI